MAERVEPNAAAGQWEHWGRERNVAIVAGKSHLAIVDVDGEKGEERLARVLDGDSLPPAPTVRTARGRHLYFKDTSNGRLKPHAKDGLDLRAGNSYAVAPPSEHPDGGHVYSWEKAPWELEPPELPAKLVTHFTSSSAKTGGSTTVDTVIPEGSRRPALLKIAGTLRRKGLSENEIVPSLLAVNDERCSPPLPEQEVRDIAADLARRYEPEEQLGVDKYMGPALELAAVVDAFRRHLYVPDLGVLYVTLATVAANRLEGDPVWVLLIGPSSSGKSEVLTSAKGLEEVQPVGVITEASLLSGTSTREKATNARGGLLKEIGDYGILLMKDFGSVLSMHRDARAQVLAALREVYDGSWTRHVGTDGGKKLDWSGKVGLIAGATPTIDRHHHAMAALGERFVMYRIEIPDRKAQARSALKNNRREARMRKELRDAVSGFFSGLDLPKESTLKPSDEERLVELAHLVSTARSAVERDTYSTREIELVPDAEAPGRLVGVLARLLDGFRVIGVDESEAWRLTVKCALDSMPAVRRRLLEFLLETPDNETLKTKEMAYKLGLPTTTTRRALEELAAHGVLVRESDGNADRWPVAAWARESYAAATVPETSQGDPLNIPHHTFDDISGTPPPISLARNGDRESEHKQLHVEEIVKAFPGAREITP